MGIKHLVLGFAALGIAAAASSNPPVTFSKDVAPILQNRCQGCHRPGEAAPMSLLTYSEARPWAKAIREAVLLKRMPPWYGSSDYGHFINRRGLTAQERETILAELRRNNYHVTNAAKALGLERSHLYKKAEQLGIEIQKQRREE